MSIEFPVGLRIAVRLGVATVALLSMHLLAGGCASSPYRRALAAIEEPADSRLAQRIGEVALAHRETLRDVEHAQGRLRAAASSDRLPTTSSLDECAAAVDRCRWSMFNLDRLTAALEDLCAVAEVSPARHAQALHVAQELRRVQALMAASVESLGLALGEARLAVETQSSAGAQEIPAVDVKALRVEVERILGEAAAVSASLRSRGTSSESRDAEGDPD